MDSGVQIVTEQQGQTLRFAGELDIRAADKILRALRELPDSAGARKLDLAEVENCDAAVLQLFCSASGGARNAGRALEFVNVPRSVLQTAAALGLRLFPNVAPDRGGDGAI